MTIQVTVKNRKLDPKKVLEATGRNLYVDDDVVAEMPRGKGKTVTLEFFKVKGFITDDELAKEYAERGLVPVDPYTLAHVDDSKLDFDYYATHWKDKEGRWCYAAFGRWIARRSVNVNRYGRRWNEDLWRAGVRQVASSPLPSDSGTWNFDARLSALEDDMEKLKKFLII